MLEGIARLRFIGGSVSPIFLPLVDQNFYGRKYVFASSED